MAALHPQLNPICSLSAPKRYDHFIASVIKTQQAWSLWRDSWVLWRTSDGATVFPLWPSEQYAQLCAINKWSDCAPKQIDLPDLIENILPGLEQDKVLPAVLPTPIPGSSDIDPGETPSVGLLISDILTQLERYI